MAGDGEGVLGDFPEEGGSSEGDVGVGVAGVGNEGRDELLLIKPRVRARCTESFEGEEVEGSVEVAGHGGIVAGVSRGSGGSPGVEMRLSQ